MEINSPRLTMVPIEWRKWVRNTAIFIIPAIIVYVQYVLGEIKVDGFSWSDFMPNLLVIGSIVTYLLSTTLDFLLKFVPANTYKV